MGSYFYSLFQPLQIAQGTKTKPQVVQETKPKIETKCESIFISIPDRKTHHENYFPLDPPSYDTMLGLWEALISGNRRKLFSYANDVVFDENFDINMKLSRYILNTNPKTQYETFDMKYEYHRRNVINDSDGILPGLLMYKYNSYIKRDQVLQSPGLSLCSGIGIGHIITGYLEIPSNIEPTPSNMVIEVVKAACKKSVFGKNNIKDILGAVDINGNTGLYFVYLNCRYFTHEYDTDGKSYYFTRTKHYLRTIHILYELIKNGCNVNHINKYGMSPLVYWVYQCVPVKYIRFLIDNGAVLSCPFLEENRINLIDLLDSSPFKNEENYKDVRELLFLESKEKILKPYQCFDSIISNSFIRNRNKFGFINTLPDFKSVLEIYVCKDMLSCYAAFFNGTGYCKKTDDLARVRMLTGSHGLRPIRNRLVKYLVINSATIHEIIHCCMFNKCINELNIISQYGFKKFKNHCDKYQEKMLIKRENKRLLISFAYAYNGNGFWI